MNDLNRRQAMTLGLGSGVVASGLFALRAHGAQDPQDYEAEHVEEHPPGEREEGQELTAEESGRLSQAFLGAIVTFLLKRKDAAVIEDHGSHVLASTIPNSVRQDANFWYVIVSRSKRYAIAKKPGLLNRHQVYIKIQAGRWNPVEKALSRPLVGNLP
jgi:hypothetical protein